MATKPEAKPTGFAEAFAIEVQRASATGGECRVAIRKEGMKPEDNAALDTALASNVSAKRISAAFSLISGPSDLAVGDTTIKNHRLKKCSCYR